MTDTLLGKLRALEERLSVTVEQFPGVGHGWAIAKSDAAYELAGLLPQIIAQIAEDSEDADRLRWLRHCGSAEFNRAIDAGRKERT